MHPARVCVRGVQAAFLSETCQGYEMVLERMHAFATALLVTASLPQHAPLPSYNVPPSRCPAHQVRPPALMCSSRPSCALP